MKNDSNLFFTGRRMGVAVLLCVWALPLLAQGFGINSLSSRSVVNYGGLYTVSDKASAVAPSCYSAGVSSRPVTTGEAINTAFCGFRALSTVPQWNEYGTAVLPSEATAAKLRAHGWNPPDPDENNPNDPMHGNPNGQPLGDAVGFLLLLCGVFALLKSRAGTNRQG